jgi:probable F420-dependent oxidoreductase
MHPSAVNAARLQVGLCIPNFRPGAGPEGMLAATQTAERLGWHSAFTTDHLLIDGAERGANYRHIYEAVTVLAWLAGQTTSIRLGMSVLVLPMRNAVVLAKELASLDSLSDGRLIAGLGIGWNRAEFENVGTGERFSQRGAYLDETIALWRHLWGGGSGPWSGRFHEIGEAYFSPLPPQGAELPIWIGAGAEPALRRVGRLADGYHATSTAPATLAERREIIAEAATAAERPLPTMSARLSVRYEDGRGPAVVSGTPEEMAARLRAYREAGADHVALDFGETEPDMAVKSIERFDHDVLPLV